MVSLKTILNSISTELGVSEASVYSILSITNHPDTSQEDINTLKTATGIADSDTKLVRANKVIDSGYASNDLLLFINKII